MLSPLVLPLLALLPLLPVRLAGPVEFAAVAGSKALLIPSGKKLFKVVPVGNKRLLSASSLCAAREVEASWSETLTTYDGFAGSPSAGPAKPGALMGTVRIAASRATMNLLRRVWRSCSFAKLDWEVDEVSEDHPWLREG